MRRQHDADAIVGCGFHQVLEELVPGEWVEAGHRFVEHKQLGPLRDRERECQLSTLTAGELAGSLGVVEPELVDAALATPASQFGLSQAPNLR